MTEADVDRPPRKRMLSRSERFLRLVGGVLDPRAWAHALKLVNYYHYSHVRPLRDMRVGPNPSISPNATFANGRNIIIGANVRIGARCALWGGVGRGRIVIGDDVMFGPEVMVTAATYRFNDGSPVTKQPMDEADVTIGNDVWLGARCMLLPGASVGDGAIIGAGAIVTKPIPPMAIAVGAPARVVGQRRNGG